MFPEAKGEIENIIREHNMLKKDQTSQLTTTFPNENIIIQFVRARNSLNIRWDTSAKELVNWA